MNGSCREKILLAFSPMNETADLTAVAHLQYMQDMLEYYGKTLNDVEFLSGDNCNTNIAISDRFPDRNTPLVGCAAHRFNLAMKAWFEEEPLKSVIEKIELLSGKLSTTKMATRLRSSVGKVAKKRQETRWQGTSNMIRRYTELRSHLLTMDDLSEEIIALIPTIAENNILRGLAEKFKECDKAWKILQDRKRQDLLTVRAIFDHLIRTVRPEFAAYIGPDAPIVHNKHFENAVVKILDHKESMLSTSERNAVSKYLLVPQQSRGAASTVAPEPESPSGIFGVLEGLDAQKKARTEGPSLYRSLEHVTGTSTLVEQLNSYAKLIFHDRRKSMYPRNLEILLMLKFNRWMWDIELVNKIVLSAELDGTDPEIVEDATFDEDDEEED